MTFWTYMSFFLWWNINGEFLKNVLTNIFKAIKSELVLEQKYIIKVLHMSKNFIDFSVKIFKFGLTLLVAFMGVQERCSNVQIVTHHFF